MILTLLLLAIGVHLLPAQAAPIKPANLGDLFPAFTLPAVQGGEVTLSSLKGKNVLIIFPRGRVDDHWCQICHYQYAELADLEKAQRSAKSTTWRSSSSCPMTRPRCSTGSTSSPSRWP